MAASVAQFAQNANWFTLSTKTATGLAWTSGDVIVVVAGAENAGGAAMNTPTNANLTFSLETSQTTGGTNECGTGVWTAVAGSSQSGQTVQFTTSPNDSIMYGLSVWVITSASGTVANAASNRTESAFSVNPTAGSVVIYGAFDWSATSGKTINAGTGTATERVDTTNTSNYGIYAGDWAGVSAGSTSFGISSYAGMTVSHAVIEILAAVGGGGDPTYVMRPPTVTA